MSSTTLASSGLIIQRAPGQAWDVTGLRYRAQVNFPRYLSDERRDCPRSKRDGVPMFREFGLQSGLSVTLYYATGLLLVLIGYVLRNRFRRVLHAPLGIVYATLNPRGRQIVLGRGLLNGGLPLLYLPDQFRLTLRVHRLISGICIMVFSHIGFKAPCATIHWVNTCIRCSSEI